jgi:hypothetical protein
MPAAADRKASKLFFFGKKNQKTFACFGSQRIFPLGAAAARLTSDAREPGTGQGDG